MTTNNKIEPGKAKPQASLLPGRPLLAVVEILEHGTKKYGVDNWKSPADHKIYYDSICRHFIRFLDDPMSKDQESGKYHLAHIVTIGIIMLWHYYGFGKES